MINPYREQPSKEIISAARPRGWFRTMQYSFLIFFLGKWKNRFFRCRKCLKTFRNIEGIKEEYIPHIMSHPQKGGWRIVNKYLIWMDNIYDGLG